MNVSRPTKIFLLVGAILAAAAAYGCIALAPAPPAAPDTRAAAAALRAGDYGAVIEQVRDRPADQAGLSVRALGKLGRLAQPVLNRLIDRQTEPRRQVRAKAATALNATLPTDQPKDAFDESVTALVGALKQDPAFEVRISAATTLGLSRSYEAMDDLIDAMNDEHVEVRREYHRRTKRLAATIDAKELMMRPTSSQACHSVAQRSREPAPTAFTLTELLAVIAVVALLVVLLIPAAGNLTRHAHAVVCMNNLHQIGAAAWIEGANGREIPVLTWVETLRRNVDGQPSIFRCPASDDYYSTASGGASGGSGSTDPNSVDISQYIESWGITHKYDTPTITGIYPLQDDTPWGVHLSEAQRWAVLAEDCQNRPVGDYQTEYSDRTQWCTQNDYYNLIATVYAPDGSGTHYFAIETYHPWVSDPSEWDRRIGEGHYRFCKPFIKVESYADGVKVWVSPEAPQYAPGDPRYHDPYQQLGSGWNSSGSANFCLVGRADAQTLSNKGTITLKPDWAFSISEDTVIYKDNHNLQPGVADGDLTLSPPPYLICSKAGYEDYLLLPPTLTDGGGGGEPDPEESEDLRTNYGMNELAGAIDARDPGSLLAIDYVSPTVKISPELDDWDTAATYDTDADNVLDFARHREKVHVLFVGGDVRAMDPDDINPKEASIRSRYWQP